MTALDVRRFVQVNEFSEPYPRYVVGSGNSRVGQRGAAIATIGLKHAGGYEILMHMDNGRIESFAPMQLFPEC